MALFMALFALNEGVAPAWIAGVQKHLYNQQS
jgi:hypothetical protein